MTRRERHLPAWQRTPLPVHALAETRLLPAKRSASSNSRRNGLGGGRLTLRRPLRERTRVRGDQNLCRIPACTISCLDVDDRSGAPGMSAWSSDEPVASPATFWYAPVR